MSYETSVPPVGVDPKVKALADSYFNRGLVDNLRALRCEQALAGMEELANGDPANARRISWTFNYVDALVQLVEQNERLLHRLTDVTPDIEGRIDWTLQPPTVTVTEDES